MKTIYAQILNSVGLFLDIVGVWLVAFEIVKSFKGEQYGISLAFIDIAAPPEKTDTFKKWESKRLRSMKIGLVIITIGFLLQISSSWTAEIYNFTAKIIQAVAPKPNPANHVKKSEITDPVIINTIPDDNASTQNQNK